MNNNGNGYSCIEEYVEICNCPKLGEPVPDFEAETTHGKIKFSDFNKGHWVVLFSHPADFTPVCTTEFAAFADKQDEFDKRNVKLLGLSIDSVYSHIAWIKTIEEKFEVEIRFPVIADLSMEVANKYAMIHPAISEVHAVRTIYIIDPDGIMKCMIAYPQSVGRNINEIIRLIDAIQLAEREKISTPANWKPGEKVIVSPPKTMEEARKGKQGQEECTDWFLCKRNV